MAVFDVHQPEVGLTMGLILSDGYERQHHCYDQLYSARQKLYNRDEGIMGGFKEACRRLGLAVYETLTKECWRFEANSALLYLLLRRYDQFIVRAPANVKWAFIKGLMLGDGCVSRHVLYSIDLGIINAVSTLLKMQGVEHAVQGPYSPRPPGRRPLYGVYMWRPRMARLADGPPRIYRY